MRLCGPLGVIRATVNICALNGFSNYSSTLSLTPPVRIADERKECPNQHHLGCRAFGAKSTRSGQARGLVGRRRWSRVDSSDAVSYTHLRAHETVLDLVCRLLLEKKKNTQYNEDDDAHRLYTANLQQVSINVSASMRVCMHNTYACD